MLKKKQKNAGSIYAYYLHDPLAFNLYNHFKDAGVRPNRITIVHPQKQGILIFIREYLKKSRWKAF